MMPVDASAKYYDKRTIVFHWLITVLVVAQWTGAHLIDEFPRGALRIDAISAHITCGVFIGLLTVVRIWWRVTQGRRLPGVGTGAVQFLAKAMHWGLYLLILGAVGLGLTLVSVHSFNYFNLFSLPTVTKGSRELLGSVLETHELVATLILVAAGLHAVMALVHHYVWRDGVLARMIPRLSA
jgi:cytochrome b561